MAPTPTLETFLLSPLQYDVRPLARLHAGGVLEPCGPFFPPAGPCFLLLWTPGGEPAFRLLGARLVRGRGVTWALEGAPVPPPEGWVVLWASPEDVAIPAPPAEGSAPGAAGKDS